MTDWARIITDLNRHMRLIDIAEHCGRTEGWVTMLRSRQIREPSYSAGCQLVLLHAQIVSRETQDAEVQDG